MNDDEDRFRFLRGSDVHHPGKSGGWAPPDINGVAWLKASPPAVGQNRPIKDMQVGRSANGHTPPSTAEFDKMHSSNGDSDG
jgi:hypothetical protein